MERGEAPAGYAAFATGVGRVVALASTAGAVRAALLGPDGAPRTLYDYAARHPTARTLSGRGTAYAVPLPDGTPVVVRRSRHGGLLAPLTRDWFLEPTRAPHELATALRLRDAGVPTPDVVCYVVYPAGGFPRLRRVDVATREVAPSRDLAEVLGGDDRDTQATRAHWIPATARLLSRLTMAGARHPDLNLKNILLAAEGAAPQAWVIDVDRIVFGRAGDPRITAANVARLVRSARKLAALGRVRVSDAELAALAERVAGATV